MTEYTRQQIDKARQLADAAHDEDMAMAGGVSPHRWVDVFTEHLGVTLAPEKPAPGVYLTVEGYAVIVGGPGINHCGGNVALINGGLESIDDSWKLRPAYVVSEAEYKRLTRDAGPVGKVAAWDKLRQHSAFDDLTSGEGSLADRMIGRLNDLTKAPAAPVELPTREQVRDAIEGAGIYGRTKVSVDDATHAVMALLEGGQK